MPLSTLELWEAPGCDPQTHLQGTSPEVDTGQGIPLPIGLLEQNTVARRTF